MENSNLSTARNTNIILGVAIAAALFAWGAYAYLFHSVAATGKSDAMLASQNAKLDLEQSEASELQQNLAANQAQQPVLNSYFVDAADPVPLFQTLEGYGVSSGVAVTITSVDVKRQPDRLVVTLTGDGSFADTYRFIALVEAAPYEFSFSNVTVKAVSPAAVTPGAPKAQGPGEWQTNMTLAVTSVTGAAIVAAQK